MNIWLKALLTSGALSFAFVGEADSASATVTMPGGIVAGDIGIILQYAGGDGDPTIGSPSGWTAMFTPVVGGSAGGAGWARILDGTETTVNTGTTASEISSYLIVIRPSSPVTTLAFGTWSKEATSGNPVAQSVDPTALAPPVIVLGMAGASSGSFSFSAFSPSPTTEYARGTGNLYSRIGYRIDNTTPQLTSIDMNDQGTRNVLVSGYVTAS